MVGEVSRFDPQTPCFTVALTIVSSFTFAVLCICTLKDQYQKFNLHTLTSLTDLTPKFVFISMECTVSFPLGTIQNTSHKMSQLLCGLAMQLHALLNRLNISSASSCRPWFL